MSAGRRECEHLSVDAVLGHYLITQIGVAMLGDDDVVVAGVVQHRIPVIVGRMFQGALAVADGGEVARRIEVVVKIDDGHEKGLRSFRSRQPKVVHRHAEQHDR